MCCCRSWRRLGLDMRSGCGISYLTLRYFQHLWSVDVVRHICFRCRGQPWDMVEQYLGARPPVQENAQKKSFSIRLVWLRDRLQHMQLEHSTDMRIAIDPENLELELVRRKKIQQPVGHSSH
ncbi:hypothetical protein PIB30_046811 [Stylosanthes scabra]|uniref:Uncharacterized protein n=1 Tax=Stylosanthes scabra TaxID=79078 RepID=A0ABU6SH95_9FABA|nr:hypothetical protein [Stylosanthes scabra]